MNREIKNRSSRLRGSSGFSLIEVLVAMFVIVVGILGVMSALYWGMSHSDSGKQMTEASTLARTLAETIRLRGVKRPFPTDFTDAASVRKPLNAPPFSNLENEVYLNVIKGQNGAGGAANTQTALTRYQRNVSLTEMAAAGSPSHLGGLARLSVKIYWREKSLERRVNVETIIPITEES